MRFGLVGEGTRGDLAPLRVLAEHLLAAGHEVRVVSRPDFAWSAPPGAEFRAVGTAIRAFTAPHAKAFRKMGLAFRRASQIYLHQCLRVHFGELPSALTGCDVVLGAGMALGVPSVAERLGIPYRLVAYCPAVFRSHETAPLFFPFEGAPLWVRNLLWSLAEGPFDAFVGREIDRKRRDLGLGPIPRVGANGHTTRHLMSTRPVLVADPALGPVPGAWRGRVDVLPYWMPEPEGALPDKLEQFLASGPPPVFFGFGSMPDDDPAKTTDLLCHLVQSVGCRALVSAGWAGLGARALPAEIAVVDDVPHTLLFPRVAAVVHHGGAGTTTAAARAGVPQLVIPHVLDQYYWGAQVHRLGLGPAPLPRARARAGALEARVRGLLEAEWLIERARTLAETLRVDQERMRPDLDRWLGRLETLRE